VPEHAPQAFDSCAVCGRSLLRGERAVAYLTPDGEAEPVCPLCRSRAEDLGWIRADSPAAHAPQPGRQRRGLRGLNLRQRAERLAERARPQRPEPAEAEPERPEPSAEPPGPAPPETPEQRIRRAIERFNDSGTPRVVAGLTKSLGRPQAAVRELDGPARIEVTIAWDLSWYRWEVGMNGGDGPRQVAKGAEVEELSGEELDWNAAVDADGRLRWREAS
jgi:hypothetical protein